MRDQGLRHTDQPLCLVPLDHAHPAQYPEALLTFLIALARPDGSARPYLLGVPWGRPDRSDCESARKVKVMCHDSVDA